MKVEVGYITAWRRAIFFTFIFSIILFGTVSSIASAYIGGIVSNIISVGILLVCVAFFILVLADKWDKYSGLGIAEIKDGVFIYEDKKRHYKIKLEDIKKVDIENVKTGENLKTILAYRILIQTVKNKKYYIESDRASGREYNEVDIYNLYLYLMENTNK